jgi:lipoyl(octanoyl) transferase
MWLEFSLDVKQDSSSTLAARSLTAASPPPPPQFWRLLLTLPADGAWNMALDEALMEHARRTNEWVLRVYAWSAPTLSFGRNQRVLGVYLPERLERDAVSVVRRPTGGRAILHWREITYSVVAPANEAGDLRESYGRINRLLLAALGALGVRASVIDSTSRRETLGMTPCFDHPSVGELVVNDQKLVGSAQWRADGALLQHGSILVEDDQSMVASLAEHMLAPPRPPATLRSVLGFAPTLNDVADALFSAAYAEDPGATELPIDPELVARARSLTERYSDHAWTWRR